MTKKKQRPMSEEAIIREYLKMKDPEYIRKSIKERKKEFNLKMEDGAKKTRKLTFYVDGTLLELIERYLKSRKKVSAGQAIRELVRAGLREKQREGELQ